MGQRQKIKCQPLTEHETAVVLSVPALISNMIEIQDIGENCHKFMIDTLNKLEDLDCIVDNRDENGKLLSIRLVLHNIINQVDKVEPIVEEAKKIIKVYITEYMTKMKEDNNGK